MPHEQYDDEIDLVDLLMVIWKYRRLIVGLAIVVAVIAASLSLTKPRTYTAQTSIINMVDNRFIRNVEGFDFQTLIQAPRNSILQAILNSQSLTYNVLRNNELLPVLFPEKGESDNEKPSEAKAVNRLKKMVKISANDRDSTLTISVTTRDPELSARIANAYTRELDDYLKTNTFSSVQKSRAFLEQQLEDSRKTLEDMIKKMEAFQNENGIFDFENQMETSITAYNKHALLLEKYQTEARMTESISSPNNPKVLNLNKHIATIEHRMEQLKKGFKLQSMDEGQLPADMDGPVSNGPYFIPLDRITEFKIKMDKFNHDIKNQQKVHDLFVDAYEKITIQDAKEKIFVTILDKAAPPLRSNGRGTLMKVLLGLFMGGFLGLVACFTIEFYQNHIKKRFVTLETNKNRTPFLNPASYFFKQEREKHVSERLKDVT